MADRRVRPSRYTGNGHADYHTRPFFSVDLTLKDLYYTENELLVYLQTWLSNKLHPEDRQWLRGQIKRKFNSEREKLRRQQGLTAN